MLPHFFPPRGLLMFGGNRFRNISKNQIEMVTPFCIIIWGWDKMGITTKLFQHLTTMIFLNPSLNLLDPVWFKSVKLPPHTTNIFLLCTRGSRLHDVPNQNTRSETLSSFNYNGFYLNQKPPKTIIRIGDTCQVVCIKPLSWFPMPPFPVRWEPQSQWDGIHIHPGNPGYANPGLLLCKGLVACELLVCFRTSATFFPQVFQFAPLAMELTDSDVETGNVLTDSGGFSSSI